MLSYAEAIVIGALQGLTELFPVSSLGHSVLIPALIGGKWAADLNVSAPESPYLAFIVGLHVATALALLVFFWRDWVRIIGGFFSSIRHRRVSTDAERLAWLIVLATIPVGIAGLLLEHVFRTVLGRPLPAAAFLMANGLILFAGDWLRRRSLTRVAVGAEVATAHHDGGSVSLMDDRDPDQALHANRTSAGDAAAELRSDARLARIPVLRGVLIGAAQILALLPGISRSGATMVAGLAAGLSHRDAARFSFLLATPVILAAGVLKVPDLFGPLGAGIHGQILAGSIASFVCALVAVRFLSRYFRTKTLLPFACYSLAAGAIAFIVLAAR
jgi:undecaprenyl-diphosphatase